VADVPRAVESAVRDGAAVHTEPADVGDGIVTAIVRIPAGNLVGFIFNPHFNPECEA